MKSVAHQKKSATEYNSPWTFLQMAISVGHVTYTPLNLMPSTSWILETERAGKTK